MCQTRGNPSVLLQQMPGDTTMASLSPCAINTLLIPSPGGCFLLSEHSIIAKQQTSSQASLQQGSSSSPLQMTLLKCLLPTQAFATPYSLVTSQGPGEISKGADGAVQAEKGLGKAEGNALFVRWVLGNGVLDKRHVTGRRGGMGTQRKIQACRKPSLSPSQLLGCFRGGMEAGGREPTAANTPHPSYMENVPWTRGLTAGMVWGLRRDSLPQTQPNCGRGLGPAADAFTRCPPTWG